MEATAGVVTGALAVFAIIGGIDTLTQGLEDRDYWTVTTGGLQIASGVAIAAGRLLHRRLPERFLQAMAAVLFGVFGLWILFDSALGWPGVAVAVSGAVAVSAAAAGFLHYRRARGPASAPAAPPDGA